MNGIPIKNVNFNTPISKYQFKGKKGVTDLKHSTPFDEYGNFYSVFPDTTKEDYDQDPALYTRRVGIWNRNYIKSLHESGEFGLEYTVNVQTVHNPVFDSPNLLENQPLSSYSFTMMDFSDDQK